jgi:hypothetical protein
MLAGQPPRPSPFSQEQNPVIDAAMTRARGAVLALLCCRNHDRFHDRNWDMGGSVAASDSVPEGD